VLERCALFPKLPRPCRSGTRNPDVRARGDGGRARAACFSSQFVVARHRVRVGQGKRRVTLASRGVSRRFQEVAGGSTTSPRANPRPETRRCPRGGCAPATRHDARVPVCEAAV
jgi:hypothetical protein